MPYTPFHIGPGLLVKAALPRHFSLLVFGMTQIALDLEVLRHMMRQEYPNHTFFHTYLGATLVAATIALLGKPVCRWATQVWNGLVAGIPSAHRLAAEPPSWLASFTGATFGALSHILLDSIYHPDITPLRPWSDANRLLSLIGSGSVELICVVMGMAGLLGFLARWIRLIHGPENHTM